MSTPYDDYIATRSNDPELTPAGVEQAQRLAHFFGDIIPPEEVDTARRTVAVTAGASGSGSTPSWARITRSPLHSMTKSMAAELAPKNIRVNAINPVIGETGMIEQFMGMPDTPENRAKFIAGIPLGRFSRPLDIANAALFLADPASAFITGASLEVDGGRCI